MPFAIQVSGSKVATGITTLAHFLRTGAEYPTAAPASRRRRLPDHPRILRQVCGYKRAKDSHDTRALQHYLGKENIGHTLRHEEKSPDRFEGFRKD
jgi:hypothetical protein